MILVWQDDRAVPVTRVTAGPCSVVQIKNQERDGYDSVQLGYGFKKEKNIKKPQRGHLKGLENFRYLKEFKLSQVDIDMTTKLHRGDKVSVSTFSAGDKVKVSGISKGKGFQGVVKRHGFHGQDKSHGNKDQLRMPGSIGAGEPQHVFKGVRMGGRTGGGKVTISNLKIMGVDEENNILLIKGGLPGARNSLVLISGQGELKFVAGDVKPTEEKPAEKPKRAEEKKAKSEPAKIAPKEEFEEIKTDQAPATTEAAAQKSTPTVAVKTAAEVKEEVKKEAVAEEASQASAAPAAEKQPARNYLDKFNHLPVELRDKISSPEIIDRINKLEDEYKLDLISLVAKILVKELETADLSKYLESEIKLEAVAAQKLAETLKTEIFAVLENK